MRARVLLLVLVLVAALCVAILLPVEQWIAAVIEWAAQHRALAWLALIVLYLVAALCVLPAAAFSLAAGAIFGVGIGCVVVSIGSTAGALLAFLLGRTVAHDWVQRRIARSALFRAVDHAVAVRGFWVVVLTRMTPVLPYAVLNYAYGVTRVGLRDYLVGSWLGMMPLTLAYVYAGSVAANLTQALKGHGHPGGTAWWVLGLGVLATVTMVVIVTRAARGFLEREIAESSDAPARPGADPAPARMD